MNTIYIAVVSVVLLVASYLVGGTYSIVPVSSGTSVGNFVMNRFTGRVWVCNVNLCREVPTQVPAAAN